MKYIVFAHDAWDKLCPIVFPEHLVHDTMAKDLLRGGLRGWRVDSAGFLSCMDMKCHGRSETLNVESNPERDTRLIAMIDYNGGMA